MEKFRTEYKTINSKLIIVDEQYQRNLNFARVKQIVAEFDPNLVNPVKVSCRDGKYYVFDGQHTLAALKLRNSNNDLMVNCKVFYGMTMQQEANLFAKQNGISTAVQSDQKLRSLYVAGNEDVLKFKSVVESCGIKCTFDKRGANSNSLIAYSKVYGIFKKYGETHLIQVLNIIKQAWNGEPGSLSGNMIEGVSLLLLTYANGISTPDLVKRLQKVSPVVIEREARVIPYGKIGKKFARQILNIYNKNSRNKLEDKFI